MTNQIQQQHQNTGQPRRAIDIRIPAIEKYAYCLCLHVRPTTIFIAVFKLIRALLFASILVNAELSLNEQANDIGLSIDVKHKFMHIALHIAATLGAASVCAIGIYAVISGRAALLMPMYAMLLVDFFFNLPAIYSRDLESLIVGPFHDRKNYQDRDHYTRYSLILYSTVTMLLQIYFLCVIWKCYRYLRLIELVSPLRLSEIYPHIHQNSPPYPIVRVLGSTDSAEINGGHNVAPPPYESIASTMKPPNYEEAIKTTNFLLSPSANTASHQQEPSRQQTLVYSNPTNEQQNTSAELISGSTPGSSAGYALDLLGSVGSNSNSLNQASVSNAALEPRLSTSTSEGQPTKNPQPIEGQDNQEQPSRASSDSFVSVVIGGSNDNTIRDRQDV